MNRKGKYVLAALALFLAALATAWQLSGASLTGTIRQIILQTAAKSINGTLTLGDVDFSWSGNLSIRQVNLKDATGKPVAAAQSMSIEFSWSDVLSRNIDISKIKKIKLDGLDLQLSRDKNFRWNIAGIWRKDSSSPSTAPSSSESSFRGVVSIANTHLSVSMPESRYEFKNVKGTLDFARYPDITIDLATQENAARLLAKGSWNMNQGGKIAVSAESVNPATFSANIPLAGTVSAAFNLTGTTEKPAANGSFHIPSGTLGTLAFSDAAGEFSFSDGNLTLAATKLNALGGVIHTSGPVSLDTLHFSQAMSGQNLDSAQLSEKDIQGRLQFSANVAGQESWDGANADGEFSMGPGAISGIAFDALQGNFSKRGNSTRYYNIRATIAGQTVYIDDADSLTSLKVLFKTPNIPGVTLPAKLPSPQVPQLPKVPSLPKLF